MRIGEHRGFDKVMDWTVVLFGLSLIATIGYLSIVIAKTTSQFF